MAIVSKVGPNGPVKLESRFWLLIADAAKEAGIDPDIVVVTQGSYNAGKVAASGTTHARGGAADIRVWNLPKSKLEAFVVALRERNCCAWLRDKAHGWKTGDHIHVILRDDPDLSSGAAKQVAEYDRGLDGLQRGGKDYHPRPVQKPWPFVKPKPVLAPFPGNFSAGYTGKAVSSLRYSFGLPNPGHTTWVKGDDLSAALASWFKSHPWLLLRKSRPSVVDKNVYASVTSKFPK